MYQKRTKMLRARNQNPQTFAFLARSQWTPQPQAIVEVSLWVFSALGQLESADLYAVYLFVYFICS